MSVYLVGAGPGDPGLVTVRGLELVRACDVLVYDRLVHPALVEESPRDALRIAREPLAQEAINELLVGYGRAGLEVVRLKGGDPFVFGRGAEEALALVDAGVPFEVVPGVSALAAVPATASIPVTHRGVASQVTAVAAHDVDALDAEQLARLRGTLVFFMGLAALPRLAERLLEAGLAPETPAAVVSRGTLEDEEVVVSCLAELARDAENLASPSIVVVGDVVAVGSRLRQVELCSSGAQKSVSR